MNHPITQQKRAIFFTKQIRGVVGACVCTPLLFVGIACSDEHIKEPATIANESQHASQKPTVPLYTPNSAIGQGQLNALQKYISKKWRLTAINNIPISYPVVIDLTRFQDGLGQAITNCGVIHFELDTTAALSGGLSIVQIERKLTDCSDSTEDDIMRILGDLYGFTHHDNILTLMSLKDELKLIPAQ